MKRTDLTTMLRKVLLVAVGVTSLVLPPLASADVSYTPPSGNKRPVITVSGQMRREDLFDFLVFVALAREDGLSFLRLGMDGDVDAAMGRRLRRDGEDGLYSVRLDSNGGDVETALAMGRILRRDSASAVVPKDGKCVSSCVFVLAGATERGVYGAVGIHRPYWPVDNAQTVTAQKQQYERLEKHVKAFLKAVNIPQELYDHMIRIPPGKMKVLSPDDLQRYGLNEDDPYEDAAAVAVHAKLLGISTEECIRREAKAKAECIFGNDAENGRCYWRVISQGR